MLSRSALRQEPLVVDAMLCEELSVIVEETSQTLQEVLRRTILRYYMDHIENMSNNTLRASVYLFDV
jgi:hypothetical protein